MTDRRQLILDTVSDLMSNLLYYNRKEDEELPVGAIEEAVWAGEITESEILAVVEKELHASVQYSRHR